MSITADDRLKIYEVIVLHGHLCDAGAYERFGEVFTRDVVVDASGVGLAPLPVADPARALDDYIDAGRRRGPGDTIAVHTTNIVVREDGDDARAWSKGTTVSLDGSLSSFTYEDRLVRTAGGWRIKHRTVVARTQPGQGPQPTAATASV